MRAADAVTLIGRSGAGRAAFAGVSLSQARDSLQVWLTGAKNATPAQAAARAAVVDAAYRILPESLVSVLPADRTYEQQLQLMETLKQDKDTLESQGIELTHFGPDEDSNTVLVGVRDLNPAKTLLLQARYGLGISTEPGQDFNLRIDRFHDAQQWSGGLILGDDLNEGLCTGGPAVIDYRGLRYLLTAGHCFSQDANVTNNYVFVGHVTGRYPYYANLDVEVIPVDSRGYIWRTYDITVKQQGWRNPSRRSIVCTSGITTGGNCNLQVTAINQSIYPKSEPGRRFDHQSFAAKGGAVAAASGDSGAPVYYPNSNGTVTIAGVVSAGKRSPNANGSNPYPADPEPCPKVRPTDTCDPVVTFTEFSYIRDLTGLDVF